MWEKEISADINKDTGFFVVSILSCVTHSLHISSKSKNIQSIADGPNSHYN